MGGLCSLDESLPFIAHACVVGRGGRSCLNAMHRIRVGGVLLHDRLQQVLHTALVKSVGPFSVLFIDSRSGLRRVTLYLVIHNPNLSDGESL